MELRELEHENDKLRQQLETQSFDIFFHIREEISKEFEEKTIEQLKDIIENEESLKDFEANSAAFTARYTDQEEKLLRMKQELQQLQIKLK